MKKFLFCCVVTAVLILSACSNQTTDTKNQRTENATEAAQMDSNLHKMISLDSLETYQKYFSVPENMSNADFVTYNRLAHVGEFQRFQMVKGIPKDIRIT